MSGSEETSVDNVAVGGCLVEDAGIPEDDMMAEVVVMVVDENGGIRYE